MEERELTALLQQLADRTDPGPAPVRRIVDAGEALRGRRSGRVRMFAVAAAAAAVVGGGSVAAVVLDLPSSGGDEQSAAGAAADAAAGAGGDEDAGAQAESGGGGGTDDGDGAVADAGGSLVVTPGVATPGAAVELAAPDEDATFGLAWRLERLTAGGWVPEYTLVAPLEGGEPTWYPAGEDVVVRLPAVADPVTLVVPPEAAPGGYRICQSDGSQDLCALLTVTR